MLLLESTLDTLPTHSSVVTRWLKLYLLYDVPSKSIVRVTVTNPGPTAGEISVPGGASPD